MAARPTDVWLRTGVRAHARARCRSKALWTGSSAPRLEYVHRFLHAPSACNAQRRLRGVQMRWSPPAHQDPTRPSFSPRIPRWCQSPRPLRSPLLRAPLPAVLSRSRVRSINDVCGVKESDTGLAPPSRWDLVSDKQMQQEEQPLQVGAGGGGGGDKE